ncbi:hypothetical protein ECH_1026 [Ehrlichia chaffeensis str. Arkansas]|uniref:Uncharacterized protein n=1 Tax=Ehrlichia chaffeensis (strain ATCC CRL-10679 / Arkansas) TaxID=205920 RepID=Q2GFH1_EHRCR|nr:hypothetical protein ECH_1026 [Ehrlichia chaffeensis str. Arkansas]
MDTNNTRSDTQDVILMAIVETYKMKKLITISKN